MSKPEPRSMFLPLMLARVAGLFGKHGLPFDASNQTVMILPRSNKSLIGAMNEAKLIIRDRCSYDMGHVGEINWQDLEKELNETPYSRIGMDTPDIRLKKLLTDPGTPRCRSASSETFAICE